MAVAEKPKIPGITINTGGHWRCNNCSRTTVATPVCAGAYDDGHPCCGRAVCSHCADRCIRCGSLLCPDCYKRSQLGALCVKCPAPAEGRENYVNRLRARASIRPDAATRGSDWQADSDRAYKAAAEAQQSVDDAMRRADEIEQALNEMKARMRKNQDGKRPNQS